MGFDWVVRNEMVETAFQSTMKEIYAFLEKMIAELSMG